MLRWPNPFRRFYAPRRLGKVDGWGVIRVALYGLAVSLFFSFLTLRAVLADGRESALQLGRDLATLADTLGTPELAVINGVRVFVGAKHVELTVDQVLDRFDRYCQEHSGKFDEELANLGEAERARLPIPADELRRLGIMRIQANGDGALACLAAPEGSTGIRGFVTRMGAVVETGDLARLGSLRYVFAKRSGKTGSSVISIWNEGPVNLSNIFPVEGDVPGQDVDGIPRPPGSARVFDAQIPGTGYGVRSYATREPKASVLATFEQRLTQLGWQLGPSPYQAPADEGSELGPRRETNVLQGDSPDADARTFTRDGAVIFVDVQRENDETFANIVTMGTRGDVEVKGRTSRASHHDVEAPPSSRAEKGSKP